MCWEKKGLGLSIFIISPSLLCLSVLYLKVSVNYKLVASIDYFPADRNESSKQQMQDKSITNLLILFQ